MAASSTTGVPNRGCEISFQGVQEAPILITGTWHIYHTPVALSRRSAVGGTKSEQDIKEVQFEKVGIAFSYL